MLKQSLKTLKLFQQRFDIVSTRFNNVKRAWQTLSTLPFNKIERMLKQMLNYPPNIFSRRTHAARSYIFGGFFRVSFCGFGEQHFIAPSLASAKSLVFLDQLKVYLERLHVSWFFLHRNKIRRRISNRIFGGF